MPERRALKTLEEEEADAKLYYELPRKDCEQICPAMLRLKFEGKREQVRVHKHLKRMIKRAEIPKVHKHIQHIIDFDKSESIIPHGEVSKKIYDEIWNSRDFNLYGKQVKKKNYTAKEVTGMKSLAKDLGVEYKREQKVTEGEINVPDIFDNITDHLEAPALTTLKHNIGFSDVYNAPVGLSKNPSVMPIRSEGNENFFAYVYMGYVLCLEDYYYIMLLSYLLSPIEWYTRYP